MYRHHKKQMKRAYNAQILEVERGVFTPLFFSTSGGMGEDTKTLFKRVAAKMANKTGQKYSETITFIRKRLRFDLNTTVIALQGYRGKPSPSSSTEISHLDLKIEPKPQRTESFMPFNFIFIFHCILFIRPVFAGVFTKILGNIFIGKSKISA